MNAKAWLALVAALFLFLPHTGRCVPPVLDDAIRQALYPDEGFRLRMPMLNALHDLRRLYASTNHAPIWLRPGGIKMAHSLLEVLQAADEHGLNPEAYHVASIKRLLEAHSLDHEHAVGLELLLSDAFIAYATRLLYGLDQSHEDWEDGDPVTLLLQAVNDVGIKAAFSAMIPSFPGYVALKQALAHYRKMAFQGGWPTVPDGPSMHFGDDGERVLLLRRRLMASGDLNPHAMVHERFDKALEAAVRRFQMRHGLAADGVVGPKTLQALNRPVEWRIQQILLNLDRIRSLPLHLGKRFLLVNVAGFYMEAWEDSQKVFTSPVIVGRQARQTPQFRARMTYMVINPFWVVPRRIAVEDLLPVFRQDPKALQEKGFHVYSIQNGEQEVDPTTIDWSKLGPDFFPYLIKQEPGPLNALGRIKFIFPNSYHIYLHDTPARELFSHEVRSFSSGCIRVMHPIELAEILLKEDPKWDKSKILSAIESGKRKVVRLPAPVPVYIVYWTAWADENGRVHFRNDVYGRDPQDLARLR